MASSEYDILKSAFEGVEGGMTPAQALYTILYAAVRADGEIAEVEVEEQEALMHRSKTIAKLRKEKPEEYATMTRDVAERFRSQPDRLMDFAADAAASLAANDQPGMAFSAFAHAADIVFADSKVVDRETRFLISLAERLKLPPAEAKRILDFLREKNAY